jgi:ABC-2 type transport system ATP-binding protein
MHDPLRPPGGVDRTDQVPAVTVRGLSKTYGDQRALNGLDLTVQRGESLGLLGPNGAGKTTTIRILSTLVAPTSGEVRVLGLDPMREGTALRARIGVVPQEVALYDELTARENLTFFGRLQEVDAAILPERVESALATAGLVDRAADLVKTYSGGMKRRLNIVTSLLHEPELVFLDEPTVGIDPQSRNHVYEMVAGLRAKGTTIVYTTHQLGEVERLCDRIVILDAGRAIAAGTLSELQRGLGVRGRRRLSIASDTRIDEARDLLQARGIASTVEEELPGLEDVFLSLTGRALRDEEGA